MSQFEIREFRDTNGFTGSQLVALIKGNELEGFKLDYFAVEHVPPRGGLASMNPYVNVLRFKRSVA